MPQSNFIPRRKRSRGVNSVLHIFCEGATEEAYFEAYKRKIHCVAVVIEHSHHGDPKGLVAEAIKAKDGSLVGKMEAEGTTPRQLTDLIGSLCDLTSGSGDKGTPVVLVQGYFDNFTTE